MALNETEVDRLIATRIQPILRVDGGSIELVGMDVTLGIVTLRFIGTYRGSPCRGIVLEYVVLPIFLEAFGEGVRLEMAD